MANIRLRAPEPADVDLLYVWENDSSAWHTSFASGPLSRHQIRDYIDSYDADIFTQKSLRFIIESDGRSVGTIDVFDYEPRGRHAFIGVYVCPDSRRRGIGRTALEQAVAQLAERVGLSSLAAIVADDNAVSRALFTSAGFVEVGKLTGWIAVGNQRADAIIFQRMM